MLFITCTEQISFAFFFITTDKRKEIYDGNPTIKMKIFFKPLSCCTSETKVSYMVHPSVQILYVKKIQINVSKNLDQ